jgi:hypothetical protein
MWPCLPFRWRIFVLKRIWTTFAIQWIVKQTKIENMKSDSRRWAAAANSDRVSDFRGMNSNEITHRLHDGYDEDAYSRATGFGRIKEVCAGNESPRDFGRPVRQPVWGVDDQICSMMRDFLLLRLDIWLTHWRARIPLFDFVCTEWTSKSDFDWTHHAPTRNLKMIRVDLCLNLLTSLKIKQ